MSRAWVWLQVIGGWLPVWALYAALVFVVHGSGSASHAGLVALRSIVPAALLGLLVHRLARSVPWPRPFRARFLALHVAAALAYALAWMVATGLVESAVPLVTSLFSGAEHGRLEIRGGPGVAPFVVLGMWLYAIVAGISYTIEATARASLAEATAARTQLAALRAQLHPHFLFNALHTVVQLIPVEPERAQDAAEQVAALLRATLDEDRDLVSLADEWTFVSRYLDLERIRFGDRLRVHAALDETVMDATVPSFALQTLVENAVRHGAAPRVGPTDITVTASATPGAVTLCVRDDGDGASPQQATDTIGTGLARLRERLAVLYGGASRLAVEAQPGRGWTATLVIPRVAALVAEDA